VAQNIKGKIIDAKTGKHSLCQHKSKRTENLVSNAEGFMLSENNSRDEIVLIWDLLIDNQPLVS
jgi:hypothetical protein